MEKDIKRIEEYIRDFKISGEFPYLVESLEHLIARNKELEKSQKRNKEIIKHLENQKAKYYEDNVLLLRKKWKNRYTGRQFTLQILR